MKLTKNLEKTFLQTQLRRWRMRWRRKLMWRILLMRYRCCFNGTLFIMIANSKLHNLQSHQLGLFAAIPSSANLTVFSIPLFNFSAYERRISSRRLIGSWLSLHTRITASSVTQNWWKWGNIFVSCPPSGNNTLLMGKVRVNWADYNLQGTVSREGTREQKLLFFEDNWDLGLKRRQTNSDHSRALFTGDVPRQVNGTILPAELVKICLWTGEKKKFIHLYYIRRNNRVPYSQEWRLLNFGPQGVWQSRESRWFLRGWEYTRMRRRRRGKEVYASKMGENQLKINCPIRRLPQLGKPLGLLQNKCCQKKGPHNLFRSHKTGRNMGINYGSTYLETSPS